MYTLSLRRDFIARHTLADNAVRSRQYRLELMLEGDEIDSQGYLVDIEDVDALLDRVIDPYREKTLNELDGFEGENPSLERFARLLCVAIDEALYAPNISAVSVRLWASDSVWATYDLERE